MTSTDSLQLQLQSLNLNQDSIASLNKKDLKLALEAFSNYDAERRSISVAYAYLASVLLRRNDGAAGSDQGKKRAEAIQFIAQLLESWLSDTSFPELSRGFAALAAILEVDKASFSELLQRPGTEDRILEAGEIISADYKIYDPEEYTRAKACLAAFISQAAVQSTALGKKLANPDGSNWLYNRIMDGKEHIDVRAAAAVAFVKFQGISSPRTSGLSESSQEAGTSMLLPTTTALFKVMKESILQTEGHGHAHCLQLGLEGLGVATLKPSTRRLLSRDTALVDRLLKLGSQPSCSYAIAVILANLTKYPRDVDADEKVKASLRRYANRTSNSEEEPEQADEMNDRCAQLLQAGIMPVAVSYSKTSSPAVQRLCGQLLLGLVENVKTRGTVIQQGGAKALLEVILRSSIAKKPDSPDPEDYVPIQALAKLLITSNPLLVLGPTPQSPLLVAALKPLASPLLHEGSTVLQQFESLMALTNVTSLSEELQERLARLPSFPDKIDSLILESDSTSGGQMCRRAAVELLCNLASCETIFIRYSAIDQENDLKEGRLPGPVSSRINILLALSDAEDPPTREAAMGALATFTQAPTVAKSIGADDKKFGRISQSLTAQDPEDIAMQLRAIECVKNVAAAVAAKAPAVIRLLKNRIDRSRSDEVKVAGKQALEELSVPA